MRLAGKVALITGGSRGMGRAIALGFAREGADVTVNYRSQEGEARAAVKEIQELGRRALAVQADVARAAEVRAMVDRVIEEFGRIDVLVNNAGILKRTPFLDITEAEWDAVLDVNLKGCFLVTQAVAREMVKRRSGVIINMSSIGQQVAGPNVTPYNTSKGGVAQFTRQAALELVDHGIRVNAICPGLIETDINRRDIAQEDFRARRLAGIPMKVIGKPEDVVGAALFLASDESRLVTGSHLFVDAGVTMI
ncbi:MAG: 3-oxoacyl-ACP reductase FabG [Candidatus Rokubacteria bacterium]|nr:3-oxoacyl-ACP reductase FabG [Candidatus Rokubacteria bacterium]